MWFFVYYEIVASFSSAPWAWWLLAPDCLDVFHLWLLLRLSFLAPVSQGFGARLLFTNWRNFTSQLLINSSSKSSEIYGKILFVHRRSWKELLPTACHNQSSKEPQVATTDASVYRSFSFWKVSSSFFLSAAGQYLPQVSRFSLQYPTSLLTYLFPHGATVPWTELSPQSWGDSCTVELTAVDKSLNFYLPAQSFPLFGSCQPENRNNFSSNQQSVTQVFIKKWLKAEILPCSKCLFYRSACCNKLYMKKLKRRDNSDKGWPLNNLESSSKIGFL